MLVAASSKGAANKMTRQPEAHMATRLIAEEPNCLAVLSTETDIVENLKRINSVTRRAVRAVLDRHARDSHNPNRHTVSAPVESPAH